MWVRLISPLLLSWLDRRALRLPASVRKEIAERFGVEERAVEDIEAAVRRQVLNRLRGREVD